MIAPRTVRASSTFANFGSSPPHITGNHSNGMISSGPTTMPVRKPSRSDRPMQLSGAPSDIRKASRGSRSTGPFRGFDLGMALLRVVAGQHGMDRAAASKVAKFADHDPGGRSLVR